MQKNILFVFLLLTSASFGQKTIDEVLKKFNTGSVPYITVESAQAKKNVVYIDSRESNEYQVSHIKKAHFVGYNNFNPEAFDNLNIDKNATIVVYCSVGVRSENIGRRLLMMGYINVYNLYGGIFEWKNKNGAIVDKNEKPTNKVHCYSPKWGQYLINGDCAYED